MRARDPSPVQPRPETDTAYARSAFAFIAVWTLARFWLTGRFELVGDEAYYWLWSKHLDYGYFSKPPGIAWAIALGTALVGDTERGVRLATVALGAGTGALLYRLAARMHSRRAGFWTVVVASVTPLFIAGGLLMTIDAISVFFWLLAVNLLWDLRERPTLARWCGAGAAIALGALAKPVNFALIPSAAIALALAPADRRLLRGAGFPAMAAIALLALIPMLVWNHERAWIMFRHIGDKGHVGEPFRLSPGEFASFVGTQALVIAPWFFLGILRLVASPARATDAGRFLIGLSAPLLLFYAALALNKAGGANWTAPAWATALVLLGIAWPGFAASRPWARLAARAALAASGAVVAIFLALLLGGLRIAGVPDPLVRARGWSDLAAQVRRDATEHGAAFVIGHHYMTASLVAFYAEPRLPVFTLPAPRPRNQFDLWPGYRDRFPPGTDALYIGRKADAGAALAAEFESVEPLGPRTGASGASPGRTFHVFLCRGLRATPGAAP